ncbi:hypothetical protein JW935_16815 [candidate division KSB1 bacterium]|nr:hypothetical protein [candidate division KSB1 bacterium]
MNKKQGHIRMDQNAVLDTIRKFKEILKSANIHVEKLILYGSYAKEEILVT